MVSSDLYAGILGFAIVLIIFVAIIGIAFLVFTVIGRWKLYQKSGEEGWKALIPVYSEYTLIKIAGLNWWWIFIVVAPILVSVVVDNTAISRLADLVSILANIAICYNLKEKFHKDQNWFILSVFFGGITVPILGLSKKDTYDAAAPVKENAFFGGNQK